MAGALLEEIVSYVGFTESDAANLRALAPVVEPQIPEIVRRFYEVLTQHPQARQVFRGGEEQMLRQQELLSGWLAGLFELPVDDDYCTARFRIGTTHVQVGLPQRYMPLGMEIIWREVQAAVAGREPPDADRKLASLHKLLMIDLAIMVESYHASDVERVRSLERDAMAEQLIRAEHLAEIGQLAASLAHEIKNPLAGISGAIQIMGASMQPDNPHREIVHEILGQIGRLDATVRDLLTYARPSPPAARELNLASVVQRVLALLREEPDVRKVRIDYAQSDGQATLFADATQIEQLLVNLILNAAHASPEGATIEVSTHSLSYYTRLIVRDRGCGMRGETLERCLEPFYTTKAKGTGLGLAICRRIAESHGGLITVESAPGEGTTVCVELPRGPRTTAEEE